jgi:hypothetical protein
METLAYLHSASICEEIAPIEPVFGEDDAYLFDGVISVKRLSSLALLGLLPLSVAFSVMANPDAAHASHCKPSCVRVHRPKARLHKKVVYKKTVYTKVVYYQKKSYKKQYRCHRPKVRCKTVCYKVKPCARPVRHHHRPACH